MIGIEEWLIPDEKFENKPEHKDLINEISKILTDNTVENKSNIEICFNILYTKKSDKNILYFEGYDKKYFSFDDDIKFSIIRAEISRILRNNYCNSILLGVPFICIMSFGDNKYKNNEKYIKQSKVEESLSILPVPPKYTLDKMIISEELRNELNDVISLIKLREKIYVEWGFEEVDPVPRAVINFYGQPGTGKTMAAHALADKFKINILVLNYADIESKYVGDAPKNLMQAFEIAKKNNALLFFDEADSFLGKRITNVTQSADQAVNSFRSQLLMLLEDFNGIVIFATNLMENYDNAFKSRILKHIKFELPNLELRKLFIQKMIPDKMPVKIKNTKFTKEEIDILAEISEGFSGREIKNAVLNGIVTTARLNKDYYHFEDAKKAFDLVKKSIGNVNNEIQLTKDKKRRLEKKIKVALKSKKLKKNYNKINIL